MAAKKSFVIEREGEPPASQDGMCRTDDEVRKVAAELGCTVDVARSDQLFIDIDSSESGDNFTHRFELLLKHFPLKEFSESPSKSGWPNRHVRVTLKEPLPELARIALQAALGSDPIRELLSVRRSVNGEPNVVVFFEKKEDA